MMHVPHQMVRRTSIQAKLNPSALPHQTTKYSYIDAVRGYAALLVIICHTGGMFSQLPYPLKKLTNFGQHGVQLFFLASCVTLLLSWRSDERKGRVSLAAFWTRRFFRIAPMYYLAALYYYVTEPPASGFDPLQLLASLTFVNVWHPSLVPTIADRWIVVPGGWSIGVEFTFYAIFPLIALKIRSLRAATLFCVIALFFGCIANTVMGRALSGSYDQSVISNFLYFWFPSQLPVFALGALLYFVMERLRAQPDGQAATLLRRFGIPIVMLCVGAGGVAANLASPQNLLFRLPWILPSLLVASLMCMLVVAVLANDPFTPFINRPIRALGQVSFSAYLLHFSVLHKLPLVLPGIFDVHATGVRAIFVFLALWLTAMPITFALATLTFRLVETPMIGVGRRLGAARRQNSAIAELPRSSGL